MELLGQAVMHKKFGKGVIIEQSENKITVCFAEGDKRFVFPDVFSEHLTIKSKTAQEEIERLNKMRSREIEADRQRISKESKHRDRLYTMKISAKSQIIYNLSEEESQELESLETGLYLSGEMRGKPRVPGNVQPNTAVLLTSCENEEEEERYIVGVAMVDEYFWGKECTDGQIRLHNKYKLMLPHEKRMSFWQYFNREGFSDNWGKVPFKYFENLSMQKILYEIYQQVIGTEYEELAVDIYSYFCSANRVPENR